MSDITIKLSPEEVRGLMHGATSDTAAGINKLREAIAAHEREEKRGELGLPWYTRSDADSAYNVMYHHRDGGERCLAAGLNRGRAKLCAAAPDLAEALEALRLQTPLADGFDSEYLVVRENAEKALKKAGW